ncbi:MAG: hypothetical protein IPG96_05955 [Proteobacteria bacterium]|nr:hypothetical protein [Pseudomonadota bacterium]
MWCWGQNNSGQLGDGTVVNREAPVRASGLTQVADIGRVGSDQKLVRSRQMAPSGATAGSGPTRSSRPGRQSAPCRANRARELLPACARLANGRLRCWGWADGQLATGASQAPIGRRHTADVLLCGNGICEFGEKLNNSCAADCTPVLGDCVCDPLLETTSNSPADCNPSRTCSPTFTVGDGKCWIAAGETCKNSNDCGPACP